MLIRLKEIRAFVRSVLEEETKKPADPRKKIGKTVGYLGRPFRVRDVQQILSPEGMMQLAYVGVFDDDPNDNNLYHVPVDKAERAPAAKARKPEGFSEREFTEQDIEHFLRAANQEDGRPNVYHVREQWAEISKELSWMEKYIFENKWLHTPMAKTNDQLAEEMVTKLSVVKAAETRAFHKIEKIIMRDDDVNHDLKVIKTARAMHTAEQPMAKIVLFLKTELRNKDWMNQIDFLKK